MKKKKHLIIGCLVIMCLIGFIYYSNRKADYVKVYRYEYSKEYLFTVESTHITEITDLNVIKQIELATKERTRLGNDLVGGPNEYLIQLFKEDKLINEIYFYPSCYNEGGGMITYKRRLYSIPKSNNDSLKSLIDNYELEDSK